MQAYIGIVGVFVGAALSALFGYTQERHRTHTQTRAGMRLLHADLEDATWELTRRLEKGAAAAKTADAVMHLKELWGSRQAALADGLERLEWDRVSYKVRLIAPAADRWNRTYGETQLKTVQEASEIVGEVLARLERRWRSRLQLPKRRSAALAPPTLADLVWARFLWKQTGDADSNRRYQLALQEFEASNGQIVDAFWTSNVAAGVALTERHNRGLARLLHGSISSRYFRVTDFATRESPALAELLYRYDEMALRIYSTLHGTRRRIALKLVVAGVAHALAAFERYSDEELGALVARSEGELAQLANYCARAGAHGARRTYAAGAFAGLFAAAVAVVITSLLAASSPVIPIAVVLAGAAGALLFLLLRQRLTGYPVDPEFGRRLIVQLGATRTLMGAAAGAVVYAISVGLAGEHHWSSVVIAFLVLIAFFAGAATAAVVRATFVLPPPPVDDPRGEPDVYASSTKR